MPKTELSNGSVLEPDLVNSLNRPKFDGQDLDGHFPKITNDDLSDDPSQIKGEWTRFRDQFKVTPTSGLSVTYQGGAFTNLNGLTQTISTGSLAVANNATSYIFVTPQGTALAADAIPLTCIPLAIVITVNGFISQIVDLRPRFVIQSQFKAVRLFGGSGNEGAYNPVEHGTELTQGEYYFSQLNLPAGQTLTINKLARIYVSGTVNIAGTIVVTQALAGGGSISGANLGDAPLGRLTGNGPGGGSGASPGASYNYLVSPTGSGGASGALYGTNDINDKGTTGVGGNGGGGLMIEAAGSITVTGTITCNGGNAGNNAVPEGSTGSPLLGGAGGGSGGLLLFKSLTSITFASSSTLSVVGGNGSNAIGAGPTGGGGGGGGQIVLISPNNNTSEASVNLSGGSGGSPTSGNRGGSAGGSFGGKGARSAAHASENGQLILRSFLPVA